jgi:hypothetical protein
MVIHAALLPGSAISAVLKPRFFKWIKSSEIAAGVTPAMRDAWPKVSGLNWLSFCLTSNDKACTAR